MAVNLVQNADGSVSFLNELDGKVVGRMGGPRTADASTSTPAFRSEQFVITPLDATKGVGGSIAQFQNLTGQTIYVTSVILDIQTGSTASTTVKMDVGNLTTSSGTSLISALDVSSATVFVAPTDGGGARTVRKVTNNQYVNLTMTSGSATGLVGVAIIGYIIG